GSQGVKTVISLILSIILIFKILIPQTLSGTDPILIALIISIAIAIITLTFIAGFNKKAFIAILGTLGGLLIAIIISFIFAKLTYLNGLSTEEARTLFYKFPDIDPQGVFFAGIIIAALGAVMDVAMSIASSLTEIKQANPHINFSKLFKSGINVGKDIMGTMSNTLIFAYVGVSLPLLLLYTEFGDSYINFINLDFITDEIVRSIGGSIGLITVIPITSLLAAFLYSKKK
ncbi:MAG: YibE/F family protein, partial [Candidatus Buchananbacteria bacterium]|nr:YibE/F family protein [Candidatus Buchananbacteria bacterium]